MYIKMLFLVMLPALLLGCASSYPPGEIRYQQMLIREMSELADEHEQRIVALEADILRLNTALEKMREEAARRLLDLEFKIVPGTGRPGPLPNQEEFRFKKIEQPVPAQTIPEELKRPEQRTPAPAQLAAVAKAPETVPAAQKPAPSPAQDNENAHYRRALDLYFAEHSEKAREEFRSFIEKFPQSSLLPNAWYWMAETHYMEKDYPRAILVFRQVVDKFPDDPKTPDSLLKIGYAYERLGDYRNALFYLGILTQDYPNSNSAARAQTRINELRTRI